MPDLPDLLTRPHPDAAHEALRVAMAQAFEVQAAEIQRLNDALLLLLTTADFAQGTLNTTRSARQQMGLFQTAIGALQQQVGELGARVGALEPPIEPPEVTS